MLTISFVGFVFSLQKEEEAEAEVKEEVTPAEGGEEVSIFFRDVTFFSMTSRICASLRVTFRNNTVKKEVSHIIPNLQWNTLK